MIFTPECILFKNEELEVPQSTLFWEVNDDAQEDLMCSWKPVSLLHQFSYRL